MVYCSIIYVWLKMINCASTSKTPVSLPGWDLLLQFQFQINIIICKTWCKNGSILYMQKLPIFSYSGLLCSSPAFCLHILTIYILIQSNNLAWGFELSYCPLLPICQGTCWDAELEGIVRKWSGKIYCSVTNSMNFFTGLKYIS